MSAEPTDEQLLAFAAEALGSFGDTLNQAELLRETVTENRGLWLQLYRLSRSVDGEPSG